VTLIKVIISLILGTPGFILRHYVVFTLLPAIGLSYHYLEGPHTEHKPIIAEFGYFAAWWIGLGIASSVGLGTGLHTFMLYLGPHIAKVTMAANECNEVPEYMPNRWTYQNFKPCDKWEGEPTISPFTIFYAVILEASLWGLGTAIGELPPYFVAKAAALSGKKDDELAELEGEMDNSFFGKVKSVIYSQL